jgi:endonuclease-3
MISRFDPMEELVSCILSQHTADANSFPAFTKLRETYPDWQAVIDAGQFELADVIRGAGLANQKSKSIIAALTEIHRRNGEYSLENLRSKPMLEARKWLMELPGVGPKTASIVLCFALGMNAIPVDTHVYRVSWRLGVIPEIGENKAHDELLKVVPPELAFRYHSTLIQHGRTICRAPFPSCEICSVTDLCQWFRSNGPAKKRAAQSKARRARAKK